jgi:hypothetical protein
MPKSMSSSTQCARILWTSTIDVIFARATRYQPRSLRANQGQCQSQRHLLSPWSWDSLVHYLGTRNVTSFLLFMIASVAIDTCSLSPRILMLNKLCRSIQTRYSQFTNTPSRLSLTETVNLPRTSGNNSWRASRSSTRCPPLTTTRPMARQNV